MAYQDPKKVDSPRGRWRLIEVLWDGGPDEDSLAIGMWDNGPALAMRWNGSAKEAGVGHPQSRGLPTWFILPDWTYGGVLEKAELEKQVLSRAKAILGL
ncbi:MAG: hypothetical protein QOH04_740 [Sphingomonadales bacterium]|jgi:hypothetical protein|nr:hypothetical protein [Sphingomonadales bacterium]